MNRALRNVWVILLTFSFFIVPAFHIVHADSVLVFCNTGSPNGEGQFAEPCGWAELIKLIKVSIRFLIIDIGLPATSIVFAYAGFQILTSGGDVGQRKKGKETFQKVVIGFAIALSAWAIVNTILVALICKAGATTCDYSLLK